MDSAFLAQLLHFGTTLILVANNVHQIKYMIASPRNVDALNKNPISTIKTNVFHVILQIYGVPFINNVWLAHMDLFYRKNHCIVFVQRKHHI
jgi:hypothetical protein